METKATSSRFVILTSVDGSAITEHVVASAARLTEMVAGGELHLLHVIDRGIDANLMIPDDAALQAKRRAMIDGAAAHARALGVKRVFLHIVDDRPTHGILQTASHLHADLVVIGTHGRKGLDRFVMGSVAEEIVRKASCPVLVVREKNYAQNAVPEIEPPCPDCLATQRATGGAKVWCPRHSEHHPRAHLHYEAAEGATGSMFLDS